MQFHRNMLPSLGVSYHGFETYHEARRFAAWAQRVTRLDRYPCDAYVTRENDRQEWERWQVKVTNW
jgi:hypothetical protein